MTYRELRREGGIALEAAGVPDSGYDAGVLLCEAAGISEAQYLARMCEEAPKQAEDRYLRMLDERCRRRPLQQILGLAWFMGLPFSVNETVLTPRQDTEVLAEAALEALGVSPACAGAVAAGKDGQTGRLLDMCTGSGCLAVSLTVLAGLEKTVAVDISDAALLTARGNAVLNRCEIDFRQGDLFSALDADEKFDIIVCNPPYIPAAEIGGLMPEVRDYEPRLALDGGEDGLSFYRRLAKETWRHLSHGGAFLYETGAGQSADVVRLMDTVGRYADLRVIYDLAGHDRVVSGRYMP